MLTDFLALMAAAGAPPSKTVSPVTVTAAPSAQIEKHPDATVDSVGGTDDARGDAVAIWPRRAYARGTDGRVTLSCLVDTHGLAEWCKVAAESPPGQGFGRAALEMRPTFKLTPVQGPDGPIKALMTVNVGFKAPKTQLDSDGLGAATAANTMGAAPVVSGPTTGNRLEMHPVLMVDNPVWTAAASFDDVARAYPAKAGGVEGYVAAHCQVERSGRSAGALHGCQVIKQTPNGLGFDQAALSLMPKFRLLPAAVARAPAGPPLWVDVPVRFAPPDKAADRTVTAPVWLKDNNAPAPPVVYPKEAAAQGVTTGRGMARCTVAADGTLAACAAEAAEPDGLGFSEAAVKLASAMRINLWSADGLPVEGGMVHVPIRLNLRDGGG